MKGGIENDNRNGDNRSNHNRRNSSIVLHNFEKRGKLTMAEQSGQSNQRSNGFKEHLHCDWCGKILKWGRNYYRIQAAPKMQMNFCSKECAHEAVDIVLLEGFVND